MILWVLAALLGLLALLSVPLDLTFQTDHPGAPVTRGEIRWGFGLIRFPLWGRPRRRKREPEREAARERRREERKSPRVRLRWASRVLGVPATRARLLRYLRDLLRSLHLRRGFLQLELGLGDPADTGMFIGHWYALQYAWLDPGRRYVQVTPNFETLRLAWHGTGQLRLFPAEVLGRTLQLMFSPALWKGLYAAKD